MQDYGQRHDKDIGENVRKTLELLEERGGPGAFKFIKFSIPLYESVMNSKVIIRDSATGGGGGGDTNNTNMGGTEDGGMGGMNTASPNASRANTGMSQKSSVSRKSTQGGGSSRSKRENNAHVGVEVHAPSR